MAASKRKITNAAKKALEWAKKPDRFENVELRIQAAAFYHLCLQMLADRSLASSATDAINRLMDLRGEELSKHER